MRSGSDRPASRTSAPSSRVSTRKMPSVPAWRPCSRTGVDEVIVVDGQSADRTAERAAAAGAKVVIEPARGYGQAMLSGLAALAPASTIVLFIDGDGSDRPEMIPEVLEPIKGGRADFVLGSRLRGEREPGSLGNIPDRCRPPRRIAHPSALRRPLHGHVSVPSHPPRRARSAGYGGANLRLESGNADARWLQRACAWSRFPLASAVVRAESPRYRAIGEVRHWQPGFWCGRSVDWHGSFGGRVIPGPFALRIRRMARKCASNLGGLSRSSDLLDRLHGPPLFRGDRMALPLANRISNESDRASHTPAARAGSLVAVGRRRQLAVVRPEAQAFHDARVLSRHALLSLQGLSRASAVDACRHSASGGSHRSPYRQTTPSARARPRQHGA